MNITVVIATKNRNFFLARTLNYYSTINFKGDIVIIDSSDSDELKKNLSTISNLKNLKLSHQFFKGNIFQALQLGSSLIKTDYAICSGDDDYIIPQGIKKCIETLKKKTADYAAIHGQTLLLGLKENDLSLVDGVTKYFEPTCEQNSAKERLKKLYSYYGLLNFAVFKTQDFQKSFQCFNQFGNKIVSLHEILNQSLLVVSGKIGRIETLSVVRTIHSQRIKLERHSTLIKTGYFDQLSKFFISYLSNQVSLKDGIPKEQSEIFVKEQFNELIKKDMKESKPFKVSLKSKLVKIFIFIGLFKIILKILHYLSPFSLRNLLEKNSLYNESFSPVYETITRFQLK